MILIKPLVFKGGLTDILRVEDAKKQFDQWYDSQIRPLLATAVPVTGDDNDESGWAFFHDKHYPYRDVKSHTHKGYVINITEIQRGVSREELDAVQFNVDNQYNCSNFEKMAEILKRIRDEGLR